jgi:hypothetical protein
MEADASATSTWDGVLPAVSISTCLVWPSLTSISEPSPRQTQYYKTYQRHPWTGTCIEILPKTFGNTHRWRSRTASAGASSQQSTGGKSGGLTVDNGPARVYHRPVVRWWWSTSTVASLGENEGARTTLSAHHSPCHQWYIVQPSKRGSVSDASW